MGCCLCDCFGCLLIIGAIVVALYYGLRRFLKGRRYTGTERLDGKVAIITGANTGLGKAHALDLARRGARVYLACRSESRGNEARAEIVRESGSEQVIFSQLDLGAQKSIRAFVKRFLEAETRLDILVNNAAVVPNARQLTEDGLEMQFGVNHVGPFLLTNLLLDVLKRSAPSRVIVVSSMAHAQGTIDRDDLQHERDGAYKSIAIYSGTKLANVLFTRALSRRLYGTGVTANALHPGVVVTELTRDMTVIRWLFAPLKCMLKKPDDGAQTQIRLSVDPTLEKITGRYFDDCREKTPSSEALDDDLGEWLWRKTEELTKKSE